MAELVLNCRNTMQVDGTLDDIEAEVMAARKDARLMRVWRERGQECRVDPWQVTHINGDVVQAEVVPIGGAI